MYGRDIAFVKVAAALAIVILLMPGVVQAAKPVRVGSISGYVTNRDNGNPISNAFVQVLDTSYCDYTDSTGYYYIGNVQRGTYTVKASADGFYNSDVSGVEVKKGPVSLDFELRPRPPPGYVSGYVYDSATNAVIPGAYAYLRATTYAATSDSSGHFLIQADPGLYTLKVTKAGYSEYVSPTSVSVVSYETTYVGDIYMDEAVLSLPMALQRASAVWTGSNALIFGGLDDFSTLNQVIKYSPSTDDSIVVQNIFSSGRSDTSAVWTGQYAYIFGGQISGEILREVVRYNPVDNTHTTYSNGLPTAMYGTCAAWTGTFAYIFGGRYMSGDSVLPSVDIIRWDPVSNSATKISATLPSGRLWSAAAFDGQYIYVIGGMLLYGDVTRQILRFDPATEQVTVLPAMLPLGMYGMVAVKDGGNILSMGGSTTGGPIDKVYQLDLTTQQLSLRATNLPLALAYSCGVNDGYSNFLFGGRTSGPVWPIDDITVYRCYDGARNYGVEPYNIFIGGMVNAANGNLVIRERDVSIPGRGFTLELVRTYNGLLYDHYGPFGLGGWTHNYNISVKDVSSGDVLYTEECGSQHQFIRNIDGSYQSPAGVSERLTKDSSTGNYVIWSLNGVRTIFSETGKPVSRMDKNGNMLHFIHDANGLLVNVTDDSGQYLAFSYDSYKRVQTVRDPTGEYTHYQINSWEGEAQLRYVTRTFAQVNYMQEDMYYDELGRLISLRPTVEERFNETVGFVVFWVDCTDFVYDSSDRVIEVWKKEGAEILVHAMPAYSPIKKYTIEYVNATSARATCSLGGVLNIEMNDRGLPVDISGSPMVGEVEVRGFWGSGGTSCTGSCGGAALYPVRPGNERARYDWNSDYRIERYIDGNDEAYQYEYDTYGNLVRTLDPLSYETVYEYEVRDDADHYIALLVNVTNPLGDRSQFTYDEVGNLKKSIDALGNYTESWYDELGNEILRRDKRGHYTSFVYNAHGLVINQTSPTGATTSLDYAVNTSDLVQITDPLGEVTELLYGEAGLPGGLVDPAGNVMVVVSNYRGDTIEVTDFLGNTTYYSVNTTIGGNDAVTNALGDTTRYYYNSMGFLIRIVDANGHSTNFTYDSYARRKTIELPMGQSYVYNYDNAGNLISKLDPNGNTVVYTYDAVNRLITTEYPDGEVVTRVYDAVGSLLNISSSHYWRNTTYDALMRPVEILTHSDFITIENILWEVWTAETIAYDENSNVIKSNVTDGYRFADSAYEYDSSNRIVKITSRRNGVATPFEWRFFYDLAGQKSAVNATYGTLSPYYNTTYSYDSRGNLIGQITNSNAAGAAAIHRYEYSYDAMSRIVLSQEDMVAGGYGTVTSYEYDEIGQLIRFVVNGDWTELSYDSVGNRELMTTANYSVTYAYDPNNRLISTSDGTTYAYDENGNMVYKLMSGEIAGTSYAYNFDNRLIRANRSDTGYIGLDTLSIFNYSADGALVAWESKASKSLWFTFASYYSHAFGMPREVVRTRGALTDYLWWGPETDNLLGLSTNYGSGPLHAFVDGLGNTRQLVDADAALCLVVGSQSYSPFGEMTEYQPYYAIDDFARIPSFQGKILDPKTGFYNFVARSYDSSVGRFTTRDPAASRCESPYAFCGNDPVNGRDPTGMYFKSPWKAGYTVITWRLYWDWLESLTKTTYHWTCILEWAYYGSALYLAGEGGALACVGCAVSVAALIAGGIAVNPLALVLGTAGALLNCAPCISWILDNKDMLNPPDCEPITYEPLFP